MTPEAFLALTRPFAEPHLLVDTDGRIVAANPPAVQRFELTGTVPEGDSLGSHVEEPEGAVTGFLLRAGTSGGFIPGSFTHRGGEEPRRHRWEAAGLRGADDASSSLVLLRVHPHAAAAERFTLLNQKVEELSREIHQRRRIESVLQEQAVELVAMNEKLHSAVEELDSAREQMREARDEAERANRAKSEFLGVMSHELRTPLNAIMGYADLLAAGIQGTLNPAQDRQLERIRRSGRHLITLIEEILTFSRLDAGTEKVSVEEVELPTLVEEVVEMMEPLAREKGLELRVDMAPEVDGLRTDPSKVRQILVNLLSNAVKFTPEGRVGVRARCEGEWATVEVWDTGPGIEAGVRDRIFQPFEQGEAFVSRAAGGTGLGLAVSRELAWLLEGDLVLVEASGGGSRFRLSLPLRVPHSV